MKSLPPWPKSWPPVSELNATCRFCGDIGHESPSDPAPGVCPVCLDKRMDAALKEQIATGNWAGLFDRLVAVGLTKDAAAQWIAELFLGDAPPTQTLVRREFRLDIN